MGINNQFTNNKYYQWYTQLTLKANTRKTGNERHHILPRSLGGGDNESNIVKLTFREHYIAHLLLLRFTVGTARYKMLCAVQNFTERGRGQLSVNSHLYAKHRAEWVKELSIRRTGNLHPLYGKSVSDDTRKLMSLAGQGKNKSGAHKDHIRKANLGHQVTAATRRKISANQRNKQALISFNGEALVQVTNISAFCREHGLNYGIIKKVLNPKVTDYKTHKGWSGHYLV